MSTLQTIETSQAPKPVGPYAQAVAVNGFCFVSGQIGIDPATGRLVDGDISAEAVQVFTNISSVLEAAKSPYEIVQTEIFLIDLDEFAVVNKLYSDWLTGVSTLPARKTVGVAALPLGARIEVSCVAALQI